MQEAIKSFIQSKWESSERDRFPGPQPVSIERRNIGTLHKNRYLVCPKTDGTRHFLVCFTFESKKICALVNRSFAFALYPLTVPRDTLLDGEFLNNEFVIHDAVCAAGNDLRSKNVLERLDHARALCKVILPLTNLKVFVKAMHPMGDLPKITLDPDVTDGLIFTPIDEPIRMGTHNTLFKWKPLEKITIDFYLDPAKNLKIQEFIVESNFEGSPETNVIVECFLGSDKKWHLVKIRRDKSHPNNKRTFDRTLKNIRENILFSDFI